MTRGRPPAPRACALARAALSALPGTVLAIVLAGALTIALAGCGATGGAPAASTPASRASTTAPPTATPGATGAAATGSAVAATPAATRFGIAGLVPAHFPGSSAADWRAFYASIPALGGWLGGYFAYDPAHGIPAAAANQAKSSAQQGFDTLLNIGFNHATTGGYGATVDFTRPAAVQAYTTALVALARATHPPFLGIGNEVNRLWEESPAAYDAFARAVPGIVAAIHTASPTTRVFVTFQYEFLLGAGKLSGQAAGRKPEWALLDALAPSLDVVGFTTYPYFDYASPADVPADYYRQAVAHTAGKPIGFSEIGWPAAPLASAPSSDLGGSPAEQAAFIARLPALFQGVHPAFAMWLDAYDTPAAGATFGSVGLSTHDGVARPALAAWKRIAAG